MDTNEPALPTQGDLFENRDERKVLDELLAESKLYHQSQDYLELLNFVTRFRQYAPFNAMLLQIQKPGLSYAATVKDWKYRFGRQPKKRARPLIILRPFGPVMLLYDLMDTEGRPVPEDAFSFPAKGNITEHKIAYFIELLSKAGIRTAFFDAGDRQAGSMQRLRLRLGQDDQEEERFQVNLNRSHDAPTQFATLIHELGHLYLGHLGSSKKMKIPKRPQLTHAQEELEAESVSYILCERAGVKSKSKKYLSNFVEEHTTIEDIDIYQVMRAAGQVESLLKLQADYSGPYA